MSADRLFGRSYGLLYSKYIDIQTKRFIDAMISSLFESGIYNYREERKSWKRLDIFEDDPPQTISLTYFKKVIFINIYTVIFLIFFLVVEVVFEKFYQHAKHAFVHTHQYNSLW